MKAEHIERLGHAIDSLTKAAELLEASAKGRGNPIIQRRMVEELGSVILFLQELENES